MSQFYKKIVVIEFILAFLVPVWTLLIGIVTSLTFIAVNVLNMSFLGLPIIAFTICGCVGMFGLIQLLINLVSSEYTITNPKKTIIYLIFGFIALLPLAATSLSELNLNTLIWNIPVLVVIHLIYQNRNTLIPSNQDTKKMCLK